MQMATYTDEDLANIRQLIAGGITQAMIAGEMVQYRSLPDLLKIERRILADLASSAPVPFAVRQPDFSDRGV
jgi:hypothetical protein